MSGYFSSSATEEKDVTPDSGSFVGRSLQPDISSGYSHSSPGPFLGSACPLAVLSLPDLTVLGAVRLEETVSGPLGDGPEH